MMGCGKSTLGKKLSRSLQRRFVDADAEIERSTGVSIATIFETEGEAGFRRREAQALPKLLSEPGVILATGGGAVLLPENRKLLRAAGIVIYLHAPVDVLFERVRHSRTRPLLQVADPRETLRKIYETRDPLYRETAHFVAESDECPPSTLLSTLIRLIRTAQPIATKASSPHDKA
jgi:shikimate kinase